jgi:hypothetical protein
MQRGFICSDACFDAPATKASGLHVTTNLDSRGAASDAFGNKVDEENGKKERLEGGCVRMRLKNLRFFHA